MTTAFEERKRDELRSKLGSFDADIAEWHRLSKKGAPLQKHYSQVRALTAELGALAVRVRQRTETDSDIRAGWRQLEREVVGLHSVWGFYRDKWALRRLDSFQPYLTLADEFAWACYEPAQTAYLRGRPDATTRRVPPLVFLGPVHGPWALARGDSGEGELDDDVVRNTVVHALVRELPLPVVAVPWHQLGHLPDVILLAHEVAHLVLIDFVGLTEVERIVSSAIASHDEPPDRKGLWNGWSEEAFADAYGVVCGGPAFAQTLGDVLIARGIEDEVAGDIYPPAVERMALLAGALAAAAGDGPADELITAWAADGVTLGDSPSCELARQIGAALVRGPYPAFVGQGIARRRQQPDAEVGGGGSLTDVVDIGPTLGIENDAERLRKALAPRVTTIRPLVAATVTAFRGGPEEFSARPVQDNILEIADRIQSPGYRSVQHTLEDVPVASEENEGARIDLLWQILSGDPDHAASSSPEPDDQDGDQR